MPLESVLSPLTAPPRRLLTSIPFWILLVGSLASAAAGTWLILDKITVMETGILDGTATGVEVYGGQSWVVLGGALVAAGLVGLIATLTLAVVRSLLPEPPVEIVEPTGDDSEDEPADSPASVDRLGYDADLEYDVAQSEVDAVPAR